MHENESILCHLIDRGLISCHHDDLFSSVNAQKMHKRQTITSVKIQAFTSILEDTGTYQAMGQFEKIQVIEKLYIYLSHITIIHPCDILTFFHAVARKL